VQLNRLNGKWQSVEYSTFYISDEVGNYQLTVDGYSGDAWDAITSPPHPSYTANGRPFSTKDNDNDICSCKCAKSGGGGWWYGSCSLNNLNVDTTATWIWKSVKHTHVLVRLN